MKLKQLILPQHLLYSVNTVAICEVVAMLETCYRSLLLESCSCLNVTSFDMYHRMWL